MSYLKKEGRDVVLPYEIERDIFELAANAFPGHAIKLCTLSKYVQRWMEAIIYETVVLELPLATFNLFMQTFNSRPPIFFAKNVKRLYITGCITFDEAQKLLAVCSGAVEVACWVYPHTFKDNVQLQLPTHTLRRLSIPLETLWGMSPPSIEFTPSLFPRLSHLEIVNPPGIYPALQIDWTGIATLPALTHFALGELCAANHSHFVAPLCELLDQCPDLRVLIIITRDDLFREALRKSGVDDDERVVVQADFNGVLMVHEYWETVRKGGPDFWAMADQVVGSRRTRLGMNNLSLPLSGGSVAIDAA